MPDELDDAVYDAYLAFITTNLRGWPRRSSTSSSWASSIRSSPTSRVSASGSFSTPPTPLLSPSPTSAPSTPPRSGRPTPGPLTPPTPFPLTPSTPPALGRESSLPSSPSSPTPASKLKHRISGPLPLQFTPRTPTSSIADPFEAAFKASLAKTKVVPSLAPVPGLVARSEPALWRRGSGSSTSSGLPSVEEDVQAEEAENQEAVQGAVKEARVERRIPFERAWW